MNGEERVFVENILKQTLYGIANQFLTVEVTTETENEKSLRARNAVLNRAHTIIDKEIPKIFDKLSKAGINSIKDLQEKPEIVNKMLGKLETKMKENADKISEKRHKKTDK